ncbi:MAG: AMP-dependent synthetase [Gammaproteobacteria bacterium]|nr:MAG: AMP-dependent synthetase [Gammaproteobacteria bacterium]
MLLIDQFKSVVRDRADAPAVILGQTHVTYAELGSAVADLSVYLSGVISKGDRVAVLMDNSPEYIVSVYGIWLAGGVVVGLNTALKAQNLSALLAHCEATSLIAARGNRELPGILQNTQLASVLLTGDKGPRLPENIKTDTWADVMTGKGKPEAVACSGNDLAAIIYTSGTTGHPKGVMLSHLNLAANIGSIREYLPIQQDDRIMCVLPFFYSYGNSLLHSHIAAGACLILENSLMYPHKVLESMAFNKATSFSGVPSSFYLFLSRTDLSSVDLSALRYCTQAGGAMDKAKIKLWREQVKAEFFVMYGQTEASARLTYVPPSMLDQKLGSAGIGIPGVELQIQNAQGQPCSTGEQGEVCARGDNIMQGYLKDQAETQATIKNGWLHTGDLGYLDGDGFLFLVGRSKEMIKSGAHRINPREIEELIASVEGVDEVAVAGVDDEIMGQVIQAYVVTHDDQTEMKRNILRFCKQTLATYKVPKNVVFRSELPKTASGKIRKHLL